MKTKWYEQGINPDYRFSLANERTFLAWIRTALAFLAGAIILWSFASTLADAGRSATLISLALSLISAVIGGSAYYRWHANELAMRQEQRLQPFYLIAWLAGAVALLGVLVTLWLYLM